jgi:hypothetical protein
MRNENFIHEIEITIIMPHERLLVIYLKKSLLEMERERGRDGWKGHSHKEYFYTRRVP